jgi:hypothetical protein
LEQDFGTNDETEFKEEDARATAAKLVIAD